MALKVRLVIAYVFDGHERLPRYALYDSINQEEGITVREVLEYLVYIQCIQ
jgi:hypothetical protein